MTFGDNFYEADDGWTEFMITQGQKYHGHWVIRAPRKDLTSGSVYPGVKKKAILISILVCNDLEYCDRVKEIRVREGTFV